MKLQFNTTLRQALAIAAIAGAGLANAPAFAAVPGISAHANHVFNLQAQETYSSQPDGANIYSWGYGCASAPDAIEPVANTAHPAFPGSTCPAAQLPGPTLIVTEGETIRVNLANKLPAVAGNTSINFPGLSAVAVAGTGVPGRLVQEAASGGSVSYTLSNLKPGTYAYYSGTQSDLQIEMGLYGAIVVLPAATYTAPASCATGPYSLAATAYDNDNTCYDREFLFQFGEIASTVHDEVLAQRNACMTGLCPPATATLEPYRPNYYLVNGRSMPDLMDTNYSPGYPNQPYSGNPHMHPGEKLLMRVVGQGRWQHPFHFHGNHARVLGRDGNLLLSATNPTVGGVVGDKTNPLAGPLLFTIPTVSGQSVDAVFTWTGQGLNWDVYGDQIDPATGVKHLCNGLGVASPGFDSVTHEFCGDHGKAIPVTPPDPQIVANGQWYGGTPYIGLSGFVPTNLPPGTLQQNPGAGYAYMWHSHNEREITTNDVFPGGMMMMLIIDPVGAPVDESK